MANNNNNDDSSTSVSDDEEEEEMIAKDITPQMTPKLVHQCDEPIMDDQQSVCDVHQLEKDKKAVYKHPLFPLLALLLEKCEIATSTLNSSNSNSTSSSFNSEIAAFLQHQQRDGKPFLSNDPEVDALMFKAIQVLRIHLLELEKVSELCKDFCQRYIACLRTKMNSENLLRGTSGLGGDASGLQTSSNSFFDGSSCSSSNSSSEDYSISSPSTFPSNSTTQTVYQMVQTAQGLVAQPIQLSSPQQQIHGSTPISQIGSTSSNNVNNNSSNNKLHHIMSARTDSSNEEELSDDMNSHNSNNKKKQQKRGVLPKQATSIMRSWLFQHIVHPYPTEDEKRTIASQTNLTLLQVNNWFINARRRILQPMLDTANSLNSESPSGQSGTKSAGNTKKLKTTRNPSLQRFWPESIANAIQGSAEKDNSK